MTRHHHGSDTSLQSTPVRKIALVYPSATGHAIVHTVVTRHRRFETSEAVQNVWTTRGWEPPAGAVRRSGAVI
jgi:aspartate carbamoyltransferase regulatory subunit